MEPKNHLDIMESIYLFIFENMDIKVIRFLMDLYNIKHLMDMNLSKIYSHREGIFDIIY